MKLMVNWLFVSERGKIMTQSQTSKEVPVFWHHFKGGQYNLPNTKFLVRQLKEFKYGQLS